MLCSHSHQLEITQKIKQEFLGIHFEMCKKQNNHNKSYFQQEIHIYTFYETMKLITGIDEVTYSTSIIRYFLNPEEI